MRITPFLCIACLCVLLFSHAPTLAAQNWQVPAQQLAQKIASATGTGGIVLNVLNRSSLGESDVIEVRRELIADLATLGVRSGSGAQDGVTVQISLSENLSSYVWVAEIWSEGKQPSVVMVESTRSEKASAHESGTVNIQKALLLTSDDRILDAAVTSGTPMEIMALEPEAVVVYGLQNGNWQQRQKLTIEHARPWPRDLRGRLSLHADQSFDAYLPGVTCRGYAAAANFSCRDGDDSWPLGPDMSGVAALFTPSRNFFTGVISENNQKLTTVPFYSLAAPSTMRNTVRIVAGVDGHLYLANGGADQKLDKPHWGSDIAGVHSGCGSGWQILATADRAGPTDSVQAFEFVDHQPVAVSRPAEFEGPVTALWTESDGNSVTAIAHNSESSRYEAYRLTITCGQ
jgi:hypothetical protein